MEAELKARVAELESRGVALVLVEVPLLFETGRETAFDRVIVVAAPEAAQIRRLRGRDRRGEAEIFGILGPVAFGGQGGPGRLRGGQWGVVSAHGAAGEKHLGGLEKSA